MEGKRIECKKKQEVWIITSILHYLGLAAQEEIPRLKVTEITSVQFAGRRSVKK